MAERYRLAIVTYVDLLGFRERVAQSKDDPPKVAEILQTVATIRDELSKSTLGYFRGSGARKKKVFFSHSFSDLGVRCTVIEPGENAGNYFSWELWYLIVKQLSLACQRGSVLLRGAICVGQIFVNNKFVFGPALVKAYELEKDYAIYPRVVVDRDIVWSDMSKNTYPPEFITRGEDGVHFIDYLAGMFLGRGPLLAPSFVDPDSWTSLKLHQTAVERLIRDTSKLHERVKQKYIWLSLYHNSAIDKIKSKVDIGFHERLNDCKISDRLCRF